MILGEALSRIVTILRTLVFQKGLSASEIAVFINVT